MSVTKSSTKGKKGFFMLDNDFIDDGTLASLSNSALRVYLVVFRLSNSAKKLAFPSYGGIMKSSGLKSRGAVSKGIKELESCGIITKITKGSNLKKQSNIYRVNNTATVVAGVNQASIVSPIKQSIAPSSMPAASSGIASISNVPNVTGIEEIDIELAEALRTGDISKAQRISSFPPPGTLTTAQRVLIMKFIQDNF